MKRIFFAIAILPWILIACETQQGSIEKHNETNAETTSDAISSEDAAIADSPLEAPEYNTEGYAHIQENDFKNAKDEPLSTFSVDVDKASYSNVRRFLNNGQLPPAGAVRIEEMVNYFDYNYAKPSANKPFNVITEMANCPWNKKHKLVQIALKGKEIKNEDLPPSNLVFLIDVSGSMEDADKLPLLKKSLLLLTKKMRDDDRISIVTYAGNAGLVLPSTSGADKDDIEDAIENLEAGGSTAGGAGIKLAYKVAKENFKKKGNNRIIIATDGDFNVGQTSDDELVRMIEKERETGVYLSVLGFGTGNYQDNKMQQLADKGNGNHYYIDGIDEAKKVLVKEFGGTLFTIAKDVKIQVEFNPAKVEAYRLIGYENRILNKEDFNDDKKDAGEIGSGHTVTALYEIIPFGVESAFVKNVDKLKYQKVSNTLRSSSDELFTVKLRYKQPNEEESEKITIPVDDENNDWEDATGNFRLAAAVAEFGMMLRESEFKGNGSYKQALEIAKAATEDDENGYRSELSDLIKKADRLTNRLED